MWELAGYTITFKTSSASSIVFNGTAYTNNQSVTIPEGTYSIYGTYATKYAWKSWSATAGTFGNKSYQNTIYTVTGNATITLTGQSVTTAIQNLSSSNCTTTARPVYDTRDNSVYWVQKLADGKCWMLDNLAFDAAANVNSITASNTNTSQAGINALKSGGSSPYSATAISSTWGSDTLTDARINVSGTFNSIAYTKDSTLVSMDAPTTPNHNKGAYGPGQGKIGVYYNYCAASAGTICSDYSDFGNASYDICPAGWRMPTGDTSGEYNTLYTNSAIGSDATKYRNALSTPLSGGFGDGSARSQGSTGIFWSSTSYSDLSAFFLTVGSGGVNTSNGTGRLAGNSVRCVLDPTTLTINFGTGIAGVIVKDSSPEGATVGTVTTSGGSVEVAPGSNYYLLPLYNSGYTFSNLTASGGTRTSGTYGYYYYTPVKGTTNTVTVSATTLATTSSTNMQGLTDADCTPYPMAVKDTRDDEVYYVQRLADGKCWMLENLRLDLVGKISSLTTENTNVDSASLTSLTSGNRSAGDQYATAGVVNWTSSYSYSAPLVNISDKTKTVTGYGPGRNYVGGYYNYCAASAGSYCYGDGTSEGTSSGNASYDICPAGWQMPSTTSSNDVAGSYYYLYNTAYSADATNFRIALSTPLSGLFTRYSALYQGSGGGFWSSTRNIDYMMYLLYVGSSNVNPTYNFDRNSGYSVRCVTKPTMQDATSSSLAALMPNVGDTATLVDSRDGEAYLIGHLADGKYWMLDNLRLDLVAKKNVLSSSNTNATDTELGYLKNGGGSTSDQYATSGVISWPSSSYSYSVPWVAVSGEICQLPSDPHEVEDCSTWDVNTTVTSYGSGSGKVGAYYNYCAASAGTYCYGNGTSEGTSSGNATADICPYGWRMPTGGDSGEYQALYTAYSANASNFRTALSTPLSGYFYSGSADGHGSYGDFWSSTRGDNYYMYGPSVNFLYVYPTVSYYRRDGYSVRCVFK